MTLDLKYPEIFNPVLDNLYNPEIRYFNIFGGRASGKSHSIAQALIELALTEKALFLCTREYQNSIKDSSKKLLENKIDEMGLSKYFTITNDSIKCVTGSEFIFKGMHRDSESVKSTEGIKYVWVEEAQSLSLDSLKVLGPTVIRNEGSKIFFSYNPLDDPDPVVEFLKSKPSHRVLSLKINYPDNPFLSSDIIEEAEHLKKVDMEDWLHIYMGEPISQHSNAIVNRAEAKKAVNREVSDVGRVEYGADIARFGDDRIVFYKRKGHKTIKSETHIKKSIPETVRLLIDFMGGDTKNPVKIDDSGLGGGVTDMMKEFGFYVIAVNNGEKAMDQDKYPNAISEMWFNIRNIISEISILDDNELIQELTRRRYKYDTKGRRVVESKDDYKKRYGHSPDKADAFLLCYYEKNYDYIDALIS